MTLIINHKKQCLNVKLTYCTEGCNVSFVIDTMDAQYIDG